MNRGRHSDLLILVWQKATTVKIHHFFLVENIYAVFSTEFASVSLCGAVGPDEGLCVLIISMPSEAFFLRPREPELVSLWLRTYAMAGAGEEASKRRSQKKGPKISYE